MFFECVDGVFSKLEYLLVIALLYVLPLYGCVGSGVSCENAWLYEYFGLDVSVLFRGFVEIVCVDGFLDANGSVCDDVCVCGGVVRGVLLFDFYGKVNS